MANYKELSAQIAALMTQAEAARKAERNAVLTEIRALMGEYNLTVSDLNLSGAKGQRKGVHRSVPAKYRHPTTGETWSGRGLRPRWLVAELEKGRLLDSFIVA